MSSPLMSKQLKKSASQSGFTLIEVVIAISIFALLGLGCYQVVSGLAEAQDVIADHVDGVRDYARSLRLIEKDLEQLAAREIYDENGERLPALEAGEDYLIEFTRHGVSNPLLDKRSELQRIAYIVEEEFVESEDEDEESFSVNEEETEENGPYLVRYVWPVLDRGYDIEPFKHVLFEHVTRAEVELLSAENEWDTYWPASLDDDGNQPLKTLPVAIRLTVETEEFGTIERLVQMGDIPEEVDE